MVVGQMPVATDVVVIGSGPGGATVAAGLAERGHDVTLVERGAFGGACLHVGCIPSKTLLEIAGFAQVETTTDWGVERIVRLDAVQMRRRMTQVIDALTSGLRHTTDHAGVTVLEGDATIAEPGHVVVATASDAVHLHCEHIVVATGSRPRGLDGFPVDGERILDSTSALELRRLPRSLAIIGGGYIGVELATAFAKLGSEVSIVESAQRLLPGMSPALSRAAQRGLAALDVEVALSSTPDRLGKKKLRFDGPDGTRKVAAEQVIVAVGRVPNTENLGLRAAGAELSASSHVIVDEQLRAADGVFAIGDIVAGPALAHKASAEAAVVVDVIDGHRAAFDVAAIPLVVFSDPEIAAVGIQPEAAPPGAKIAKVPLGHSGRALAAGHEHGFVTLVADHAGTIIGGQVVAPHASEISGELVLAIEMAATATDLAASAHAHPTIGELLGICAGQLLVSLGS